jgi:hypothetical protein
VRGISILAMSAIEEAPLENSIDPDIADDGLTRHTSDLLEGHRNLFISHLKIWCKIYLQTVIDCHGYGRHLLGHL